MQLWFCLRFSLLEEKPPWNLTGKSYGPSVLNGMCPLISQGQLVVLLVQTKKQGTWYPLQMIHNILLLLLPLRLTLKCTIFIIRICAQLLHNPVWENSPKSVRVLNLGSTDALKFWGSLNLVPCTLFYAPKNSLRRGPEASPDCQKVPWHKKVRYYHPR